MQTTFNYPKKEAFNLAKKMRQFRAKTEETASSEVNVNADQHRAEVVRQIDWTAFNDVINQLEFCQKHA